MAINIGEVAHIQDIALFPICHVFMRAEEQDQMERTPNKLLCGAHGQLAAAVATEGICFTCLREEGLFLCDMSSWVKYYYAGDKSLCRVQS